MMRGDVSDVFARLVRWQILTGGGTDDGNRPEHPGAAGRPVVDPGGFSIFVKNDGKIIFHSLIINIILLLINVMV
ncbi:hypothetical protein AWC36_15865 [Brenneria goodwinii]|nr:hypothetical protein AWC36_15865 [Brenneria goodwinii]